MRSAALALTVALLVGPAAGAQQRRNLVESPAAALYRAGMQLLADEYWEEAAESFERAIGLDDQYPLAYYGLGRARIGQRQYTAAISALDRCRDLYVAAAGARTSREMGAAQRRQDQILELRDSLRQLQTGPQTASTQRVIQQVQDQIRDLEIAARGGIGDIDLRVPAFVSLSLGSAYFRRGSMTDAEREYRNALKANPRMGEAHNNLAVVLLTIGRPDDAEKHLKEAEKNGYRVHPQLKEDIRAAKRR